MFTPVKCPACQYKFTIPEGEMAKRHVCPNCQSPFVAGASMAEAKAAAPPQPSYAKTMLGETAPAERRNQPESSSSPNAWNGTTAIPALPRR